jgi:hypothetical protein
MTNDVFYAEKDYEMGKVLKYQRANPVGEDMYLRPDGTVESDEAKIVLAQQIFKHNYYKSGGRWELNTRKKYDKDALQGQLQRSQPPEQQAPGDAEITAAPVRD